MYQRMLTPHQEFEVFRSLGGQMQRLREPLRHLVGDVAFAIDHELQIVGREQASAPRECAV